MGGEGDNLQPGLYDTILSETLAARIGALEARKLRARLDEAASAPG